MLTLSKNKKKLFASLKYAKYRQKYNIYLVEGDKIAHALFENKSKDIEYIIATQNWIDSNARIYAENQGKIIIAEAKDIKEFSSLKTPSELIIVLKMDLQSFNISLINDAKSIYLDEVQDPGNVGTIIRIADWYGIKNVIRSPRSVDFYNPKTLQASMGSFMNVNLLTQDFLDFHKSVEAPIYATDLKGESSLDEVPGNFLLVMGNEGNGVRKEILDNVPNKIKIPGAKGRVAESLNVSVATGIVCHSLCSKSL